MRGRREGRGGLFSKRGCAVFSLRREGWRGQGKGRSAGPAVGPSLGGEGPRVAAPGWWGLTPAWPRRVGGLWGGASRSCQEAGGPDGGLPGPLSARRGGSSPQALGPQALSRSSRSPKLPLTKHVGSGASS